MGQGLGSLVLGFSIGLGGIIDEIIDGGGCVGGMGWGGLGEGRDKRLVEERERDRIEETGWRGGSCGGGRLWGGVRVRV